MLACPSLPALIRHGLCAGRLLELEADNRTMTAEVAQAKESERETARRRDEEVRHLREQVEQLILSFNSAQSQSAAAAGGSKSTEVCEQAPTTVLVAAPTHGVVRRIRRQW